MIFEEALEKLHEKGWFITQLYEHKFPNHPARTWICTVLPEAEDFEFIRAEAPTPLDAIWLCYNRLGEAQPRKKFDWTKEEPKTKGLSLDDLDIVL